ncbi:MAG TPA: 6,7-dimethyl-8-ribityllumazine synthase [Gaiellaceae bacterium]|nr:6,7-dimethyl-8-ribityllumazine synthase [Gaiellaceae bacterium]
MSDPDLREQPWPPRLEPDEEMPAFRRAEPLPEQALEPEPEPVAAEPEPVADEPEPEAEHAAGDFQVPDGYEVVEGSGGTNGRGVGIVVAKFNGEITGRLLQRALDELEEAGIEREAVTIVPVPGAFELPLAAMALAKTRKYACIVALGCVIRGDTPHFDFVAGEAASGLQLAAIETGVPVSFGVLTTETSEQAEARIDRAADAVRSALEMASLFSELRAAAK